MTRDFAWPSCRSGPGHSTQQELKSRTVKVRTFPGDDALERVVSAILVEIDDHVRDKIGADGLETLRSLLVKVLND